MWFVRFAILLACLLLGPASANFAIFQVGGGAVTFTHVKIGGAGAAIGVSSLPSANLLLARTDQYGCYISISNAPWTQIDRTDNMPIGVATVDTTTGGPLGLGCGEAIADPSNANNIWIETNGSVFYSSNQAASFGTTCYTHQSDSGPSQTQNAATVTKSYGHFIAVDPANSSIVYMATLASSLYATFDKGSTCFAVGTVSAPGLISGTSSGGGYLIAFDSSGGTTVTCPHSASVCTKNIYVSSYGTGVYKSTDGGLTWALTTSTPTTHHAMKADGFGNLFFIDNSNNNGLGVLRKFNGTTWSTPASGPTFGVGLDIDPNACSAAITCHIGVWEGGGFGGDTGTNISTDGGVTWNKASGTAGTPSFISTDVPYIANQQLGSGMFPGGAAFDNSGHLYTGAEGVFFATPPTAGVALTITSQTAGIEESLGSALATSPSTSGKLSVGTWDINCFVNLAMPYSSYPVDANRGCFSTNGATLQHTYAIDWASANTDFFVALTDNQSGSYTGYSGTSSDKGVTWSAMPAVPSRISAQNLNAGCMAAASSTNFMWAPNDGNSGNVPPYYTTDGGTTWNNIAITNEVGTLVTNGSTAAGSNVLNFASVPSWIVIGSVMSAHDQSNNAALPQHTLVTGKTATTVTVQNNAAQIVNSGDTILFSGGGWPFRTVNRSKICAADRVNANTFFFFNSGLASTGAQGVVKCTSGGASCVIKGNPNLSVDKQFGGIIKTVPGNADHIFLATGDWNVSSTNGFLTWSIDGGQNFTSDTNFGSIMSFGFGAPFPGHTYPAIVVVGWRNSVYGIWQSIDWDGAKTWQKIGTHPLNWSVTVEDVDGDKVIPNVFYYSTNSGVFCSAPSTSYCNGGT